jgi:hypothetical protein
MLKSMESFYREAAEHWCHFAHSEPMWPVNGEYRCSTCLRTYPVPWANTAAKSVHRLHTGRTHMERPKAA